jgi:hypothetical protein
MMAQRLGDEYWLYIITDAASQPHCTACKTQLIICNLARFNKLCATKWRWGSGNLPPRRNRSPHPDPALLKAGIARGLAKQLPEEVKK